MSQMVHVVSTLEVPIMLGSTSFQSNDVNGAQNSLFLFLNSNKGEKRQKYEYGMSGAGWLVSWFGELGCGGSHIIK